MNTHELKDITTENLLKEIQARQNGSINDYIQWANMRSRMLYELNPIFLELTPRHDTNVGVPCSDDNVLNFTIDADTKRVKCKRCGLLQIEKQGFWSNDLTIAFSVMQDEKTAEMIRKK